MTTTPARRRAQGRTPVVVLALALVAGCGETRSEAPEPGASGTASAAPSPGRDAVGKAAGVSTRVGAGDPRPRIVCDSDERVGGVFDFVAGAKGEPTPESAIEARLGEGESFVMTESGRTAWILRPDGTPHRSLHVQDRHLVPPRHATDPLARTRDDPPRANASASSRERA